MTTAMAVAVMVVIVLGLLGVAAAVAFRLLVVRERGTPALMRPSGAGTWQYGSLHYSQVELGYYRLVSLSFRPDVTVPRASITLGTWREPRGSELEVAETGEMIVPVSGVDRRGRPVDFDLCLGTREATALLSWVEACSIEDARVHKPRSLRRRER